MVRILRNAVEWLARKNPKLRFELVQAASGEEAERYILKSLGIALVFSLSLSFLILFVFIKEGISPVFLPAPLIILFFLIFYAMLKLPHFSIIKKRDEIESDLLYSARYLLLKMRTGAPLINSLVDVSKLHTNSSKYFKEIVSDIYLGEPLEDAIDYAYRYTPSEQFKRVLKVIKESLNTGVDIKTNIGILLKELTDEQLIKIEAYSKKINSLSLFYMVLGVVVPSLGTSVLIIAASFINIHVTMGLLLFFFALICVVEYFFILLFRSSRPMVGV